MKSTADIVTTDAARIAKRLVNHWKHKFEIEQEPSSFTIIMPEALSLIHISEPTRPY